MNTISNTRLNEIDGICKEVKSGCLHKESDGTSYILRKKACCVCDTHLHFRNGDEISIDGLKAKKWQDKKDLPQDIPISFFKDQYRLPIERITHLSNSQKTSISQLIISPRSVITNINKTLMISICKSCKSAIKRPKCSIIDIPIGHQPPEIACLNETELALVSNSRFSGHMFHMFGGCHKSIKTWHQLHVNNVGHTIGSLNELNSIDVDQDIYCILAGPFTNNQKSLALASVKVDLDKVMNAFEWLKKNNILYKDIKIPDRNELPMPIVIDHSHEESPQDSNIESKHETTVFFPEMLDCSDAPGSLITREQLLQNALATKTTNASQRTTVVSKPTKDLLKNWDPNEFVKSFPRQFPYGIGCEPNSMDTSDYLKHLMRLSINEFQRADFILVAANSHFKQLVVSNASMKCRYKCGNETAAERFNNIDIKEIDAVIDDPTYDENTENSNLSYFVRSVFAVSKLLPFTDECVKLERAKLFSMCTQFGLPTGLLTVTPDDSDNLNMYVHKIEDVKFVSKLHDADTDQIQHYLSECEKIRLDYPGYAEFEFEKAMDIVISEIFGWDEDDFCSSPSGGIFGKLNAWFLAVEEQGRKTLHGHFLIWTKGWDKMLESAYEHGRTCVGSSRISSQNTECSTVNVIDTTTNRSFEHVTPSVTELTNLSTNTQESVSSDNSTSSNGVVAMDPDDNLSNIGPLTSPAGLNMSNFLKAHVSTGCFGLKIPMRPSTSNTRSFYSIGDRALKHDCVHAEPCYKYPSMQHLRNMRFQHCPDTANAMHIACCMSCNKLFSLDDLVQQALEDIYQNNLSLSINDSNKQLVLRYLVSISQSGVSGLEIAIDKLKPAIRNTLIHIHRNLHRQQHCKTCFKHGNECRAQIPKPPKNEASCDFSESKPMTWYKWYGVKEERIPYMLVPERANLDVCTNTYNPYISQLLHCNTNLICGIDGAGIMYITLYTCKNTRTEDRQNQLCVLLSIKQVINKEMCNTQLHNAPLENPKLRAFKRIFSASMGATSQHTTASPMAKYLVLHGSRFRCSHAFTHLPFHDFIKGATSFAKLDVSLNNRLFLTSRRDTYLFRPGHLESVDPYSFYSNYYVKTYREGNTEDDDMNRFHANATDGYHKLCLGQSHYPTIPLVYHYMMESSADFNQDILNENIETNAVVEKYCKSVLLLFTPFREEADVKVAETYKKSLIMKIYQESINRKYATYLQNMQDCRNSLDSRRLPDILEQTTVVLPEPEKTDKERRKNKPAPQSVLDMIEEQMSCVISEIHEALQHASGRNVTCFDSSKLIRQGAWQVGLDTGYRPAKVAASPEPFVSYGHCTGKKGTKRNRVPVQSRLSSQHILSVHQRSIYRNTNISDEDRMKTCNIVATGSCESIKAWARAAFNGDLNQTNAFQALIADFVLQYVADETRDDTSIRHWANSLKDMRRISRSHKRVVMFLTGPGGSGKSHVIQNILEYAKQYTSLINVDFSNKTIVVTALTGVAATAILGETLHSACRLPVSGGVKTSLNNDASVQAEWEETKMLIVDEISFASKQLLLSLAKTLPMLTQDKNNGHYGGLTVCFAGDFSQLEPIGGDPLFKGTPIDQWNVWVNAFVELNGGHRFQDDTEYKDLLVRLRSSHLLDKDYKALSERVINSNDLSEIPEGTKIACSVNKDRCAMNNLAFLSHLQQTHGNDKGPMEHTMIVRMGDMKWATTKLGMTEEAKHAIYEEVSEHNIRITNTQTRDPFLKLYHGCPVMLTENEDVKCGISNGTTGTVQRIVIKEEHREQLEVITVDGYKTYSIDATHVAEIIILIDNTDKEVTMLPVNSVATAYMSVDTTLGIRGEYDIKISGKQFTFLVNHATTVHKLQGKTVDKLYIVNWCYTRNWPYVALSRVKTLDGLYLRKELNQNANLEPWSTMTRMLEHFRETKSLSIRRGARIDS